MDMASYIPERMRTERSKSMKNIFAGLASAVMIVYTIYRAFTTIVILPFVATSGSRSDIYFLLLVLLAAGITALSFTKRRGMAASLAAALGLVALFYWWVVICRASVPIWSDFFWLVVPEACFSLAGLCKWLVGRPQSPQVERQASAT
jgi:DMSO/TMAO reductase YedYZ heme-binding membrane subunit